MIRVLLVEDSITQREILRRLLSEGGELDVVAEARNGHEAIALAQEHQPDVVLMDIHMPDMDGIEATREIMLRCPVPIVVASATLKKRDIDLAMRAYEAGAVAVIEKPEGAVLLHLHEIGPKLRAELTAASKARLHRAAKRPAAEVGTKQPSAIPGLTTGIKVVGICASTGGPPVLLEILAALPNPYPLPILLVQHISLGFEEGFAHWLAQTTGQNVGLASAGQQLAPGIWLAPGGHHLALASRSRIDLPPGASDDLHCPSGNPLFSSLAQHFGPKAVGVLLTGMGDDGAEGLLALRQSNGLTVIQAEASCLIWGMPKAAQAHGAATFELHPAEIASLLSKLSPNVSGHSTMR